MKKGILRVTALLPLMFLISIGTVYADEANHGYADYEATPYYEADFALEAQEEPENEWTSIRVPLDSPSDFFIRVGGEVTVNLRNNRNWIWLTDPLHINWMASLGADVSFFYDVYAVLQQTPHLRGIMDRMGWNIGSFWELDMPLIHFITTANAQIEFDFYSGMLYTISWGGEVDDNTVMTRGFFAPYSSITLPGGPSLTAIYVHGAYSPGRALPGGHAILLVEVLGEGNRSVPAYTFNPQDHIPSFHLASAVNRANALGLVPEFLDLSLRRPISRIDLAAFAVYLYETVAQREIEGRAHFTDTIDVNAAKMGYLGIIGGVGQGTFDPFAFVPREQAAVILSRLASNLGMELPIIQTQFADSNQISDWARNSVMRASGAGLIPAEDGFFYPHSIPNLEEVIVMMVRLFDMLN